MTPPGDDASTIRDVSQLDVHAQARPPPPGKTSPAPPGSTAFRKSPTVKVRKEYQGHDSQEFTESPEIR